MENKKKKRKKSSKAANFKASSPQKNKRTKKKPSVAKKKKQKSKGLSFKTLSPKEKREKRKRRKKIIQVLQDLLLAIVVASIILPICALFFIHFSTVNGYGMTPTLRNEDVVIIKKTQQLKRFDLVLFKRGNDTQIRRVIGLPGEMIQYKEDSLYIDGQKTDEKFIVEEINESQRSGMNFTENFSIYDMIAQQTIPKNQYLLLGDNRSYATDSRHYGLIDEERIIGVVTMRILPLEHLQSY